MTLAVKICGLTTPEAVTASVAGGAKFLGVVFFAKSPRNIAPERAAELFDGLPRRIVRVGLFVDPTDARLERVLSRVRLDLLQLHGRESPKRVEAIRQSFGLPVMKAIGVSRQGDLDRAEAYEDVADRLLFDARPPRGADRPGGNATAFDWRLLAGRRWRCPWMLAGGIDGRNLRRAVAVSGAKAVDVSSGVERAPGVKDPRKIAAFLRVAAKI